MKLTKNQIAALSVLLLSKTFERTAFFLIMAILIRYVMANLNLNVEGAGDFYSYFLASIGFVSLFSGLLGDLTNRVKVVKIGMIVMVAAYLILIFVPDFYPLLLGVFVILGIGVGVNSTNMSVFVGNIFNERKTQITGFVGFVLYALVINIGGFFAPIIARSLQESFGYQAVYILAFLLAAISYVLFLIFSKIYNKMDLFIEQKNEFHREKKYNKLNWTILLFILLIGMFIRIIIRGEVL